VCKKEDVDSVSLIRKETRPCPKCGIRISKIDGCDQMWCTAEGCGTAFSWISNKIISGVVHNPHYYEWLRRNNNGVAPRPAGEILCGGLPPFNTLYSQLRVIRIADLAIDISTSIAKIHNSLSDIQYVRIPQYIVRRDPNIFKEIHVSYLLNIIDETTWASKMFIKENSLEKKNHIGLIIQTFYNAGADIMRNLSTHINDCYAKKVINSKYILSVDDIKKFKDFIEDFEKLKNYINESLQELGTLMLCAVPQFNNEWVYQAPRTKIAVV
jgi:ferritin-like protein